MYLAYEPSLDKSGTSSRRNVVLERRKASGDAIFADSGPSEPTTCCSSKFVPLMSQLKLTIQLEQRDLRLTCPTQLAYTAPHICLAKWLTLLLTLCIKEKFPVDALTSGKAKVN